MDLQIIFLLLAVSAGAQARSPSPFVCKFWQTELNIFPKSVERSFVHWCAPKILQFDAQCTSGNFDRAATDLATKLCDQICTGIVSIAPPFKKFLTPPAGEGYVLCLKNVVASLTTQLNKDCKDVDQTAPESVCEKIFPSTFKKLECYALTKVFRCNGIIPLPSCDA